MYLNRLNEISNAWRERMMDSVRSSEIEWPRDKMSNNVSIFIFFIWFGCGYRINEIQYSDARVKGKQGSLGRVEVRREERGWDMEYRTTVSGRQIRLTPLSALTPGSITRYVSSLRMGEEAGEGPGWHRLQTQPKPSTLNQGLADIHTRLKKGSPSLQKKKKITSKIFWHVPTFSHISQNAKSWK